MPVLAPIVGLVGRFAGQAATGAIVSGAVGGFTTLLESSQEHGGINQQVLKEVARGALNGAVAGARDSAIFGANASVANATVRAMAPVANAASGAVSSVANAVGRAAVPVANAAGSTFLYVIVDAATGASKIGITKDINRRLAELQRQLGRKLILTGIKLFPTACAARAAERALHARFASRRVSSLPGNEWFRLNVLDKIFVLAKLAIKAA